jgi:diguanylate cyclase (GGDEF)-like protein
MPRMLRRIIDAGVPPEMSPEEAKFIQMSNLGSLLMIAVNLPYLGLCIVNRWTFMAFELSGVNLLLLATPLLNSRGLHLAAMVYFGTVLNLHLTFATVAMGRDSLLQLLIFFTAGGTITLVPRGRNRLILLSLASILVTYEIALVLEARFGPLYRLTGEQTGSLRLFVEYSIFILIVVNALIGRIGAMTAEDRLREEQTRSESLLKKVREQDRYKTMFFQNVSHELRTPLTLILGPLDDLISETAAGPDNGGGYRLEMMKRNTRRLLRLINQLLDLSKIDSGKMNVDLRRGDIGRYVSYLAQSFAPYAARKGITLVTNEKTGGLRIYYDQEIVEKAVSNVISNACKFTPEGGKVTVETWHDAAHGQVTISVEDTGSGIPPESLERVFERFHQADGSTTRSHEGTGIGLSLVKELVHLHGGSVEVESAVGLGSRFLIRLPAGLAPAEGTGKVADYPDEEPDISFAQLELTGIESTLSPLPVAPPQPGQVEKATILVVEDNNDMREYIRKGLEGRYRVVEAADGIEGFARAREQNPQLIISDVMMPRMDGYALCRAIRGDKKLHMTPIILLTAKAASEMVVEGLESGAVDYITKPFSFDVLLARIKAVIMRKSEQDYLASRDGLTGLLNRPTWEELAERELKIIARGGGFASIAFLDLDGFKVVNDTYGHSTGDQVLVELAQTIVGELRSTDLIGRYGGEEIVLFLPGSTGDNGVRLLSRILGIFRSKTMGENRVSCTFSAGVVEAAAGADLKLADFVASADSAMYEAKRGGKARVVKG